jgi:hypothetical protein
MSRANALAYFAMMSMMKKKGFLNLTSDGHIFINLLFRQPTIEVLG